jgi:hypothetical protein
MTERIMKLIRNGGATEPERTELTADMPLSRFPAQVAHNAPLRTTGLSSARIKFRKGRAGPSNERRGHALGAD